MKWTKKQGRSSSTGFSIRRCVIRVTTVSSRIHSLPMVTLATCSSRNTRPIIPGAVIAVRPIGVQDDGRGRGRRKDIAVPTTKLTQRYAQVRSYTDLPEITWRQIEHFFSHYKDLELGKWATFAGWGDASEAKRLITDAIERQKRQRAK